MTNERLRVIEETYEAWNRGDMDGWVANFTEDVQYDLRGAFWDQEPIRGRRDLRRWGDYVMRAWEEFRIRGIEVLEEQDNRIVQRIHVTARGLTSGLTVDQEMVHVFEFDEGSANPRRMWLRLPDG